MNDSLISRKESIVLSSIEIIDELGVEALSIRTIAAKQNIVGSTIYKQFKSKEEILLEVVNYYSKYDEEIISAVTFNNFNAIEGISFFIGSIISNYEAHPALTSLVHSFEIIKKTDPVVIKVREIFEKRFNFLFSLVEMGKKKGTFPQSADSEFIATTVLGIEKTLSIKWRMNNYGFHLNDTAIKYISAFLEMCKTDHQP